MIIRPRRKIAPNAEPDQPEIDTEAVANAAAHALSRGEISKESLQPLQDATFASRFVMESIHNETDERVAALLGPLLEKTIANGRELVTEIAVAEGVVDPHEYVVKDDTLDDPTNETGDA